MENEKYEIEEKFASELHQNAKLEKEMKLKDQKLEKVYYIVSKTTFKNEMLQSTVEKEKINCRKKSERIKKCQTKMKDYFFSVKTR